MEVSLSRPSLDLYGGPILVVLFVLLVAFEASGGFHHSNWRLPLKLERAMSWLAAAVIVTR